jgi:very-short-patch-repair endonuclease
LRASACLDRRESTRGGIVSTDGKVAELRGLFVEQAGLQFDRTISKAESPIEALLLAQMMAEHWGMDHPQRCWSDIYTDIRSWLALPAGAPGPWFLVSDQCAATCLPQLQVTVGNSKYRVDFAFIGMTFEHRIIRIAVELDGHDFHERTKEQASKDKRRDRVLAANGWVTLRFTGSDVYRDPGAVLDEITATANRLCWPELEAST